MKNRYFLLAPLLFVCGALNVFAINAPLVGDIPASVDANTYTLTVYTEKGATVTVVGGPSDIAPVTDGKGSDVEDGTVKVTVALAQNTTNTYSIIAQMGTATSDASMVSIKEVSAAGGVSAPKAPVLNKIPDAVTTAQYMITGTAEANANIYARTPDGKTAGSSTADATGSFKVTVPLEAGKTNRINVSAENEAGVEGPATQAVIHQTSPADSTPPPTAPAPLETSSQIFFGDVRGHWAEDYINQLYRDHVVSGKSDGVFDPDGLITRAELTKIAILAFGHSVNTSVDHAPFGDVPANSWFAPYVEEAKTLGFVGGYESGGFGPNDFVNRAAALKILLGAAGLDATEITSDFSDVPSNAWFAAYVGFAKAHDIVGGYADGRFGPSDPMTRAQVAKVVVKLLEYKASL